MLPFLQGAAITARVDLKADRKRAALVVQAAHAEPGANAETAAALAAELTLMAGWLGLERVVVQPSGELSARLSGEVAALSASPPAA